MTARGNPAGRPHIDVVTCSKSGAGSWTLGRNFSPRFRPTKARSSHYVTRDTLDLRRIGSLPTRLAPHRSSAASNCADAPRGGAKLPGEQWISLYAALARLSSEWGIGVIADEIVRAVLVDGEVLARGHYRYEVIPRIIPKECWSSPLLPSGFSLRDWTEIEIDWIGLLKQGRNHIPSEISLPSHAAPDADDSDDTKDHLKTAPEKEIGKAIDAVYDEARQARKKPPNIKQIADPVLIILGGLGYITTKAHIEKIAGRPEYKKRRWKPGQKTAPDNDQPSS